MATQTDCKAQYRELLEKTLLEIERIDKATPFSAVEPGWWCRMIDLQRTIREKLAAEG